MILNVENRFILNALKMKLIADRTSGNNNTIKIIDEVLRKNEICW